ncbi:MAG TPA: hypothetical protein VI423_00900 [Paenisporosarcina sp.]|nr:hypothetical protein [Paenisporosarcina sp.]
MMKSTLTQEDWKRLPIQIRKELAEEAMEKRFSRDENLEEM